MKYNPSRHSHDEEALLGTEGISYTASDFAAWEACSTTAQGRSFSRGAVGMPSVTLTEDSFFDESTLYEASDNHNKELQESKKKFMLIKKQRQTLTPLGKIAVTVFVVLGLAYGCLYLSGNLDGPGSVFSANYEEAWKDISAKMDRVKNLKRVKTPAAAPLAAENIEFYVEKKEAAKKQGPIRAFMHKHAPAVEKKADELAEKYPRATKVVEYSGAWCALYNAFYCLFHSCNSWCSEDSKASCLTSCCHCCLYDLVAAPCSAERRQKLVQFLCEWPVHFSCSGLKFIVRIPACLWPKCLTPSCCSGEEKKGQ